MRVLVFGGAASGKSEYGEQTLLTLAPPPRYYLATMAAQDGESRLRVERHRAARSGREFVTVERPGRLEPSGVPQGGAVLLEDLGNLLANRMFDPERAGEWAVEEIDGDLLRLECLASHLVVVSGDLHRDGLDYPGPTAAYQRALAQIHRRLAARYDRVVEVVCGLPVVWKGEAT